MHRFWYLGVVIMVSYVLTGLGTFVFYSNGNWIISNKGEATLQVINVNSRILISKCINGSTSVNVDTAAGIYVIRLVDGEKVRTPKL